MAIKLAELRKLYGDNIVAIKDAVNRLVENVESLKGTSVTRENLLDPDFLVEVGILEEPTSPDTTPPTNPTNLVSTKYENRNRLEWTNSTSSDTRVTYVFRATTEGGVLTQIGQVSYPTNYYEDFNVQPKQSYWYYIQCADEVPNYSEIIPAVDGDNVVLGTTLPAPSTLTASAWNQEDLNMSVDPVDEFGVSGYRWEISERRTEETIEPNYIYTFAKNGEDGELATSVTVRVWALDEDGDPSPAYIEETFEHSTPPAVTGLYSSVTDLGAFRLMWTKSTDPIVTGYDLALNGTTLETNWTTEEYLYKIYFAATSYQFGVRSRNKFGQTSTWAIENITVNAPSEPQNITAYTIGSAVFLAWDTPSTSTLPIKDYGIKKGFSGIDTFTTAEFVGFTDSTAFNTQEAQNDEYQYFIFARDIGFNEGDYGTVTISVDSPIGYELQVDVTEDFFDGEQENVLVLDDGKAIFPAYTGLVRETFIRAGYTYAHEFVDNGYSYVVEPTPGASSFFREIFDYSPVYGNILDSAKITLTLDRELRSDATGTLTITPYIGVCATEADRDADIWDESEGWVRFARNIRFVQIRFEVVTTDNKVHIIANNYNLKLDTKTIDETGLFEVTDAASGVWVAYTKDFIDVKHIEITPTAQWDGSNLIPIIGVPDDWDVPDPDGFQAYLVRTDTGEMITGTATFKANGYGGTSG